MTRRNPLADLFRGPTLPDRYPGMTVQQSGPPRVPFLPKRTARNLDSAAPAQRHLGRTVLVGDSLGVGTAPHLKGVQADARVGRPSAEGVHALKRLARGGNVGRVLFDLGTNDADAGALARSLHRARQVAKGAELVVPTVNGPNAAQKNRLLRRLNAQGKIKLVGWNAPLADGIHPTGSGYRRRAKQIRKALR